MLAISNSCFIFQSHKFPKLFPHSNQSFSSAQTSSLFSPLTPVQHRQLSSSQMDKCKYTLGICSTISLLFICWAASVNLNFKHSWRSYQGYPGSMSISNFWATWMQTAMWKAMKVTDYILYNENCWTTIHGCSPLLVKKKNTPRDFFFIYSKYYIS